MWLAVAQSSYKCAGETTLHEALFPNGCGGFFSSQTTRRDRIASVFFTLPALLKLTVTRPHHCFGENNSSDAESRATRAGMCTCMD